MRVSVVPTSAQEPSHRNVVRPPAKRSADALCVLLLAAAGDVGRPAGSLLLQHEQSFAVRVASLRVPSSDTAVVAKQLLWHAVRELPALRCGGALLATPATDADDALLRSFGFDSAEPAARAEAAAEAAPLALVARRDPSEPSGYSHATLRVSDMRQSLAFWSLLHYAPARHFTTNGARAAWLSAPWTSLSIEVVEVPASVLRQTPPEQLAPSDSALGPSHLCLDVTALGLALPTTLALLQARSAARFGRALRVVAPPHQQMMGDLVAEVVVVRAPDGVQLRLTHNAATLERPTEPDWSLEEEDA